MQQTVGQEKRGVGHADVVPVETDIVERGKQQIDALPRNLRVRAGSRCRRSPPPRSRGRRRRRRGFGDFYPDVVHDDGEKFADVRVEQTAAETDAADRHGPLRKVYDNVAEAERKNPEAFDLGRKGRKGRKRRIEK